MSAPKLSIIIIAYNEEGYIKQCLDAIEKQTISPDEVILVDNNSADKTTEIARAYSFVKIINEKEQGMIPARDAGFNAAKGELLARIDADTYLPTDWIATVHTLLDPHAEEMYAVSGPEYFYALKNRLLRKTFSETFSGIGYFFISRLLLGHETLYGSNMIITRKAWEKVKKEVCHDSQEVHEDMDLAIHIGKYGTIIFDRRIIVGVSARPFREGTRKHYWRLKTWIRTVTKHRKLFIGPHSNV